MVAPAQNPKDKRSEMAKKVALSILDSARDVSESPDEMTPEAYDVVANACIMVLATGLSRLIPAEAYIDDDELSDKARKAAVDTLKKALDKCVQQIEDLTIKHIREARNE